MSANRARGIETAQGFLAFIGITIGLIPLIGAIAGFGPALLSLVLPDERDASHYIVPIAIIVVAGIAVVALEAAKKRR